MFPPSNKTTLIAVLYSLVALQLGTFAVSNGPGNKADGSLEQAFAKLQIEKPLSNSIYKLKPIRKIRTTMNPAKRPPPLDLKSKPRVGTLEAPYGPRRIALKTSLDPIQESPWEDFLLLKSKYWNVIGASACSLKNHKAKPDKHFTALTPSQLLYSVY